MSFASLATPLGTLFSMGLTGVLAGRHEDAKDSVYEIVQIQNFMISISGGLFILMFSEKPQVPPCLSAIEDPNAPVVNKAEEIASLRSNQNFKIMAVIFMILYGIYTAVGTVVSPLYEPFGYTTAEISILGATFIFSGVVASIIIGYVLGKGREYLKWLRLISFISAATMFVGVIVTPLYNMPLMILCKVLQGSFMIPIIPCGFAFAIELTHPNSPNLVNGIMMMMAQSFAFVLSILQTEVCNWNPNVALMIFAALAGVAAMLSLFVEEDLKISGSKLAPEVEISNVCEEVKEDEFPKHTDVIQTHLGTIISEGSMYDDSASSDNVISDQGGNLKKGLLSK